MFYVQKELCEIHYKSGPYFLSIPFLMEVCSSFH